MMEMKDLIDILKGMVSIPSLSRDEKDVADYLEVRLETLGFEMHRKGNNIWLDADPGSTKDVLLLNAHIDTVKPSDAYSNNPFEPIEKDGCIFGLGTNDDGASAIALLGAFLKLSSHPQPYRLVLSLTAEEEVCGRNGIESIVDDIGNISLGIIGEPTGMQMAVAEKGLMVLDCTAHGKSGHAARNEGVNALYKAIDAIEWFRTYSFDRVSDFLGPVKMSVTMINAGTQHNVVPDSCTFVVDVRNNGMYSNRELLSLIRQAVDCDVKERSTRLNGSHIDMNHPVVLRGKDLGLQAFGSPTTSNQAVVEFTTLKIGPGQSSRSHTADEYILVSEIEEGINTYYRLLDGLKLA